LAKLERNFAIDPRTLSKADPKAIAKFIRPASLHRLKALRIVDVSRLLHDRYRSLEQVLTLPTGHPRALLEELTGLGPKSADIIARLLRRPQGRTCR